MGQQSVSASFTTDVNVPTTTETVVATLSGVSTPRKRDITLKGWVQLTNGTATTAVTPRIRRGTDATGTLVGEGNPVQIGTAAGSTEGYDIETIDPGVDLSNATYVLTVQQTAATGNGTALQGELTASWSD